MRCPICNKLPTKLVPLYDNDQAHVKQMCCINCKRALRAGKKIEKFNLNESIYKDG